MSCNSCSAPQSQRETHANTYTHIQTHRDTFTCRHIQIETRMQSHTDIHISFRFSQEHQCPDQDLGRRISSAAGGTGEDFSGCNRSVAASRTALTEAWSSETEKWREPGLVRAERMAAARTASCLPLQVGTVAGGGA